MPFIDNIYCYTIKCEKLILMRLETLKAHESSKVELKDTVIEELINELLIRFPDPRTIDLVEKCLGIYETFGEIMGQQIINGIGESLMIKGVTFEYMVDLISGIAEMQTGTDTIPDNIID